MLQRSVHFSVFPCLSLSLCTCCCSPVTLMSWDWGWCTCSCAAPPCVLTCSEVGDWMGIWACVWCGTWAWGVAEDGLLVVVVSGGAPAWMGAAACWTGWAGVLVEVELGWLEAVVAVWTTEEHQRQGEVRRRTEENYGRYFEVIPIPDVGVAAEGNGVNRKRCTWPLGSAACINCCPGPGMTVTPWGMTCSCPAVWPWPWTITVTACGVQVAPVCCSVPGPDCCFYREQSKSKRSRKLWLWFILYLIYIV